MKRVDRWLILAVLCLVTAACAGERDISDFGDEFTPQLVLLTDGRAIECVALSYEGDGMAVLGLSCDWSQ
ncbi:MAG: hypothetical protein HKN01_01380 [Acidimicrobiia bacterium]|nr:hypothetical protein [Acidimicrobiia bacterium]